jgi:hypothetical protein
MFLIPGIPRSPVLNHYCLYYSPVNFSKGNMGSSFPCAHFCPTYGEVTLQCQNFTFMNWSDDGELRGQSCEIWYTYNLLTYSMEQSPSWEAKLVCSLSRNSRQFMEPKGSSLHSQAHTTCPYPELDPSSRHTHTHPTSWRFIVILSFHLRLGFPRWSPSLRFPHQNPVHPSPHRYMCYMPCPYHYAYNAYSQYTGHILLNSINK